MTSGLPGSLVIPGKLNHPNRSVTETACPGEAAPEFGSVAAIVTSNGWIASMRTVVDGVTVTVCSTVVPWAVSCTV